MKSNETRDWRPLILLAVLISHLIVVNFVMRAARLVIASPNDSYPPLILMFLPHREPAPHAVPKPRAPDSAASRLPLMGKPSPDTTVPRADTPPIPPWTDWEHEAELAAQNSVAAAEHDKNYRNLSGLSPEQLDWIKRNHMEPAPSGIPWRHPRVEYSEGGLPIIWINDHCVLVPMMMFIVFCQVGHIEANGDLFKHMRDPREP